jgi:hypothetical protein
MATFPDAGTYQLKPLDFSKYESGFHQHSFKLTKKNPFTTMTDEQWLEYISTHEAHFTDEPKYDIIPWEKLKQVENDASNAGWELILRTTNNTAYYPPTIDYRWYQCTQWIFGYPGQQLLLVLSYTESKFTLIKETKDEDIEMTNYFSLTVVSTTKPKYYTYADFENESDCEYDYDNDCIYYRNGPKPGDKYYETIKPAYGWIMNGGSSGCGTQNFNYMFVGDKKPNFYGMYELSNNQLTGKEKEKEYEDTQKQLINELFPPKFWTEWIDNNKETLMPGKFKQNIQITLWDDTYVLSGCKCIGLDEILKWQMSFLFIQKFMKSNISKWVDDVFGYECAHNINANFWNKIPPYNVEQNTALHKMLCVSEVLPMNSKSNTDDNWIPFNGYKMSLFKQKEIRLSLNAVQLIDEVWRYVKSKN